MKKLIIKEYLKILIAAILFSVVISITLAFLLFFHDRAVDDDMPQYLVWNIRQYIGFTESGISLDAEGKERMRHHDVWLQVIDETGAVVFEENTKGRLPKKYDPIELTNAVLHSDGMKNYTVYMSNIQEEDGYAVLMGCDSRLVTKYTINSSGEYVLKIIGSISVFLVVTAVVVICSSYVFSRKITNPIGDIIDDIDRIRKGEATNAHDVKQEKMFADIFDSTAKLEAILKQNDKLRAEWIVNISHDIKSPLSTIKGYSELLYDQDYEYSPDEVRMYAEQMLTSEERIRELVDDLKTSNLLIEGKITPNIEKTDIEELVRKCINGATSYYPHDKQIIFENDGVPEIGIDRKLMERCITNIICNAFVHNGKDVEVKVSLTGTEEDIVIQISDNGRGISDEEITHIFERYYRGTGTGKTEGTGLGLAIAKEIILLHGARIDVKSKVGKGTSFTILLKRG